MITPTTKANWVSVENSLPSKEEFGAYPNVMVALSCKGHPVYGYRILRAELRYFGGNPKRPYWADINDHTPIENSSWRVGFWCPMLEEPSDN